MVLKKIKLKGHSSFYLREGWLSKGMELVDKNNEIFSSEFPTDEFGVGSAMVKAIKYYLEAMDVIETYKSDSKKKSFMLTDELGKVIYTYDKYLQDEFSMWILHYHFVRNLELATTWNLFFNTMDSKTFTREMIFQKINEKLNSDYGKKFSSKSLNDDVICLIRTYINEDSRHLSPEENFRSPFQKLGLIDKDNTVDGRVVYRKNTPDIDQLDKLVVLYAILRMRNESIGKKKNHFIPLEDLVSAVNSPGRIFNLDKTQMIEYIDELSKDRYLSFTRTAGLNQVIISDQSISGKDILLDYYHAKNGGAHV